MYNKKVKACALVMATALMIGQAQIPAYNQNVRSYNLIEMVKADEDANYYFDKNESSHTAKLTEYKGSSTTVEVPATVIDEEGIVYSVTSIGDWFMRGNTSVKSVTLPSTVEIIENGAFSGCENLETVNLDKTKISRIGEDLFYDCILLKNITIPESVSIIETHAFCNCKSLKSIEIPKDVTNITSYAFADCKELTSVKFNDKIEVIEEGAFSGCAKVESIILPETLKQIGERAFEQCGLLEINIPDSVTTCGNYAFYRCENLKKASISKNIIDIPEGMFDDCFVLEEVNIPDNNAILSVGTYAFNDSLLTEFTFGENVKTIGGSVFGDAIQKVTILSKNCVHDSWYPFGDATVYCYKDSKTYEIMKNSSQKYQLLDAKDIKDAFVSVAEKVDYEYGYEVCPNVALIINGQTLVRDTDYTVEFVNNRNIGIASAVFTGKGDYTGTISKNFEIVYNGSCTHNWVDSGTQAATCKEEGYISKYCTECMSVETLVIEKLPHTFNDGVVTKVETCTVDGVKTYTCSVCKETKEEVIPAAHKYKDELVKVPTCTEAGIGNRTCTVCGDIKENAVIEAKGHSFGTPEVLVPATCSAEGKERVICSECKLTQENVIQKKAHTWDTEYIVEEATCEKEGSKYIKCLVCGEKAQTITIAKTEHKWSDTMTIDKQPTCKETGIKSYHCLNCSATRWEEPIDFTGHTWGDGELTVVATQSSDGIITKKCVNCDEKITETVNSIGKVTLSKTSYTYTGKALKPTVLVIDSKNYVITADNYTVTYKNNKNVGTATATIDFKGKYSGSIKKTFKINPKAAKLSKVKAEKKGFTASWAKVSGITGYEVQYSLDSKFKSTKSKTAAASKTSLKITKLKAGKKYYVRVRTYATVKGKKVYSSWSSSKNVKTKK